MQRPKKGGRLLELGTGAGVGTAWLLDGMDQESELITVDISAEYQQAAREAFAGDKRLEMVNCDAAKFLERQSTESFDLVFADAMPGKFFWLDEALALVKGGGFYVVDDLLPQENWPADHAPKVERLIEKLISLVNFRSVPLAWSSGIIFSFGSNFWFPEKALEDMRNFCGCAWTKNRLFPNPSTTEGLFQCFHSWAQSYGQSETVEVASVIALSTNSQDSS